MSMRSTSATPTSVRSRDVQRAMKGLEVPGLTFFGLLALMVVSLGPGMAATNRAVAAGPTASLSATDARAIPPVRPLLSDTDIDVRPSPATVTSDLVVIRIPSDDGSTGAACSTPGDALGDSNLPICPAPPLD